MSLNGVDLKEMDLKWVRKQIGLVGQEPVLFNVTIAENICCDLKVTRAEMEQAAKDANAHEFITKLPMVSEIFPDSINYYKFVWVHSSI